MQHPDLFAQQGGADYVCQTLKSGFNLDVMSLGARPGLGEGWGRAQGGMWGGQRCHAVIFPLFFSFFSAVAGAPSLGAFIRNVALPPLQISTFPGGLIYVKSQTSPMAVLRR